MPGVGLGTYSLLLKNVVVLPGDDFLWETSTLSRCTVLAHHCTHCRTLNPQPRPPAIVHTPRPCSPPHLRPGRTLLLYVGTICNSTQVKQVQSHPGVSKFRDTLLPCTTAHVAAAASCPCLHIVLEVSLSRSSAEKQVCPPFRRPGNPSQGRASICGHACRRRLICCCCCCRVTS